MPDTTHCKLPNFRFSPAYVVSLPARHHPDPRRFACSASAAAAATVRLSRAEACAAVAGDEVSGGRQLRRGIRQRGMGYVLAVRFGPGDQVVAEEPQLPAA
jgi:hypothetical protein